ncbi:glucokinase [Aquabacterium sp.]|uniref:glucokinase n=1 Tax=Aquabacterium sp. TaxID=1872578 RepID=UPI0019AEA410|nr:glucokinase [Aquabacterium sp.]MBC7699777.1 glucokinase [Aquabacterium sp.]
MILCADIGATKTLLGLALLDAAGRPQVVASKRYVAARVTSFEDMLDGFLADHAGHLSQPLRAACFGVAGPVNGDVVQMTNLSWRLDATALGRRLGGIPVRLANDFEAAASGIDGLSPGDLVCLQAGQPVPGAPQLVIGAGSGLGVAFRIWQKTPTGRAEDGRYQVVTGEGGHFGFTPINAEQDRALMRLRAHVVRPVAEHFVSGPGLANFYTFLDTDEGGKALTKDDHAVATASNPDGLTGEEICRRAVQDGEPRALHALHHFLLSYGVVAGDYALATLAKGGVFLAGGIAQKLGPVMQDGRFMVGFRQKGPYADLMATLPVHVVNEPDLGLLGAAAMGALMLL